MRRCLFALIALAASVTPAFAGDPTGKVVLDIWDLALLGEGKAGYVRTVTKEIDKDGKKLLHTTMELRLTVKRNTDVIQLSMDTGSIETPEGQVVGVFVRQFLGKNLQSEIQGTVVGNKVHLLLNGKTPLGPDPWSDDVVGVYKQQRLFADYKLKPGDMHTYRSYEPTINIALKTDIVAKGYREVELPGVKGKQKLLLVEMIPHKVEVKRGPDKVDRVQLPITQTWLDDKLAPVKSEFDVPGLGPITLYRTTKELALAPAPIAQLTDIGLGQLVKLKNRILNPYDTTAAVYRITIRNDENVASTFSSDDRQQVKNVNANTFDLHVKASSGSDGGGVDKAPAAEFVQSSYFINSDDSKVKEHARRAVGTETDTWKKALRIERWVHANMRSANHEALATADHVARTLEGDCTEYGMLTAAMCRAEGVPSRTAIGLIYADVKGTPNFAFHMWTEVWIAGRWIPIDATLGKGYVGATHLKITDSSWYDERTMTPIFPVIRVVGRVTIDVLSADNK